MLSLRQFHFEGEAVVQLVRRTLQTDGSMAETGDGIVARPYDEQACTHEVFILYSRLGGVGNRLSRSHAAAQQTGQEDTDQLTVHRGRSGH